MTKEKERRGNDNMGKGLGKVKSVDILYWNDGKYKCRNKDSKIVWYFMMVFYNRFGWALG